MLWKGNKKMWNSCEYQNYKSQQISPLWLGESFSSYIYISHFGKNMHNRERKREKRYTVRNVCVCICLPKKISPSLCIFLGRRRRSLLVCVFPQQRPGRRHIWWRKWNGMCTSGSGCRFAALCKLSEPSSTSRQDKLEGVGKKESREKSSTTYQLPPLK